MNEPSASPRMTPCFLNLYDAPAFSFFSAPDPPPWKAPAFPLSEMPLVCNKSAALADRRVTNGSPPPFSQSTICQLLIGGYTSETLREPGILAGDYTVLFRIAVQDRDILAS